jgi:hypothetical protein
MSPAAALHTLPAAAMESNQQDYKQARSSPSMTMTQFFLSTVVKDIMGTVVFKKSSMKYSYQNLAFAFFCFENL